MKLRVTADQLSSGQVEYTLDEFCDDLREWVRLSPSRLGAYTSKSSSLKQNIALAGEFSFELYFSIFFLRAVGQNLDQLYHHHQGVIPSVPLEIFRTIADNHAEVIEILKVIIANQALDDIAKGMSEEESLEILNASVKEIVTYGSRINRGKLFN